MTQDQKDLLIRDLCARLPYGVKISVNGKAETLQGIDMSDNADDPNDVDEVKPYLFPLSSMDERLREEHKDLLDNDGYTFDANGNVFTLQDFYCKYHLDYRGFIPMGLAVDATGLGIY